MDATPVGGGAPGRRDTIWSIQYLRAFAAIAVVVFHMLQGRGFLFRMGEHGVDMFFVISGFIMLVLTDGRPVTPGNFALDRLARILPPYWLATFITVLFVAAGVPVYHASTNPVLLARSLAFIPTIDDFGAIQPTLHLGWTLNFEMFFYAIFAAILFLRRGRTVVLAVVLAALVGLGAILAPTGPVGLTYISPMLLEFLAGALLGKLFGKSLTAQAPAVQMAGAAVIGLALAGLALHFPRLIFAALSVFVIAGALLLERRGKMPQIGWLKEYGDASFAIYLFQQFIFNTVELIITAMFHATVHRNPAHLLVSFVNVAAVIAFGPLLYRHVERPLARVTRSALRRLTGEPVRLAPAKG